MHERRTIASDQNNLEYHLSTGEKKLSMRAKQVMPQAK